MFDPTAFENMKVVIEGTLYDYDLDGEISIIDRNDIMNLAKLSRRYEVTFTRRSDASVQCTLVLEAKLENLAVELLPSWQENSLSGADLSIIFKMKHDNTSKIHSCLEEGLKGIWGTERIYKQIASFDPSEQTNYITKEIIIKFNRLIVEDQIDDLSEMIGYMLTSLEEIKHIL